MKDKKLIQSVAKSMQLLDILNEATQFEKEIRLVMDAAAKITEQMRAARR